MTFRKDQLEASLHEERKLIENGKLKEENPLDRSEPFQRLCNAARRGDPKVCQEAITAGANINARDEFDYTPLILASLCGHYDVAHFLLESGALCERDTFQGERCIYGALNDAMRNLLLSYDYSKSTDPLQPFAAHVTSLLSREEPDTYDILITSADRSFKLHKFILAARCVYFQKKLSSTPEITSWSLPASIPTQALEIAIRYIYLGELPRDVGGGPGTGFSEEQVLEGIDKISIQFEIRSLWHELQEIHNRRVSRQNRANETARGRSQLESWFRDNVLRQKITIDSEKAKEVKWDRNNGIFADVLLRADELEVEDTPDCSGAQTPVQNTSIPMGPMPSLSLQSAPNSIRRKRTSILFPAHRAMLLRSDYFSGMFSSGFIEAQKTPHLHIVTVDCTPDVLEAVLAFLYCEKTDFPLDLAIEVLFAADQLFIERLKNKAALVISTLGSSSVIQQKETALSESESPSPPSDILDPFEIMRAAWELRVPRLETFVARYLAYSLERFIDLPELADLIRESAARIRNREETDSIELVDDIRHYLSERFRLRFEGDGIAEMMVDEAKGDAEVDTEEETTAATGNVRQTTSGQNAEGEEMSAQAQTQLPSTTNSIISGEIRTLDGELVGDEFEKDSLNYRMLLGKIDALLERLELDA